MLATKKQTTQPQSETSSLRRKNADQPLRKSPVNPVWRQVALGIQRKLEVGRADDPQEKEADEVAQRVMRKPDHPLDEEPPDLSATPKPTVRRKCAECEEEDGKLQRLNSGEESATPDSAPPSVHAALNLPGQPLDPASKGFFESRFGQDFSGVQVHSGSAAEQSAREVNAQAYTVGDDIVFGAGRFAPGTHEGRTLLAHELAHTIQQGGKPPSSAGVAATSPASTGPRLARQSAPKPPAPAPAPCTMNCTDPAFLLLSPSAREAQLNTQCPQGLPATGNTFFGQPIPAVSTKLRSKLLAAQSLAKRAWCLDGKDPNAFVLTRTIITYSGHSPGMDKAVDIDVMGQPYIMHESNKGVAETAIDNEVGQVYDRIAFWSHYRKSIIPKGITRVQRTVGGTGTQRTWTNPNTGKQEPITTGELYDMLNKESQGMQGYFNLLLKSDADLTNAVFAFVAVNSDPDATLIKLKLPIDYTPASVTAFRQRIADDYRLLGGSKAQLDAFAGTSIANASKTPSAQVGDRPFQGGLPAGSTTAGGKPDPAQNRRPELGFISLPKEVVVALTETGLVWGAIDFGGASGDVMHFDCRNIPNC